MSTAAVRGSDWPSSSQKNCSNDSLQLKICSAEAEALLIPRELAMVEPALYFITYQSVPELPHVSQCLAFTPLDYTACSCRTNVFQG